MSDAAAVLALIDRIVRRETGRTEPTRETDELQRDLGLDSLSLMTLAVELEDHHRICLREEDAESVRTAGELAALVVRRLEEQR